MDCGGRAERRHRFRAKGAQGEIPPGSRGRKRRGAPLPAAVQDAPYPRGGHGSRASVLECGRPSAAFPRDPPKISASQPNPVKAFSHHAGTQDPLAARPDTPAFTTRHVFSHRCHLRESPPLSHRQTAASLSARPADRGGKIWLATGSLGGFLQSLSLRRPLARHRRRCRQSGGDVEDVARQTGRLGKPTRRHTSAASVVQLSRYAFDPPAVLPGAVKL